MLALAAEFKVTVVKLRRAGSLPEAAEMLDMINPKQLKDLGGNLAALDGKVIYIKRGSYRAKTTSRRRTFQMHTNVSGHPAIVNPPLDFDEGIRDNVDNEDTEGEYSDYESRDPTRKCDRIS
jgi:hypothetical protein